MKKLLSTLIIIGAIHTNEIASQDVEEVIVVTSALIDEIDYKFDNEEEKWIKDYESGLEKTVLDKLIIEKLYERYCINKIINPSNMHLKNIINYINNILNNYDVKYQSQGILSKYMSVNDYESLLNNHYKELGINKIENNKGIILEKPPSNFDCDISSNVVLILAKQNKCNPIKDAQKGCVYGCTKAILDQP